MRYIFFVTTLLAVVLFQGCSNRDESNDTNTTQTIDPSAQTLELNIGTNELPENNETTVTVRRADGKEVTQESGIIWHINDSNVTKINGTRLIAKAEGITAIQAELDGQYSQEQNVTVYKIIHGHRLPPEPDPAINNSTLLGVDSNNNGVRDDVERWIYTRYDTYYPCTRIPKKMIVEGEEYDGFFTEECSDTPVPYHHIVREIAMQFARAAQIVIQVPEKARETMKYMSDAVDCNVYFEDSAKDYGEPILVDHLIFNDEYNNIQFNTARRVKAYAEYNMVLGGGVYTLSKTSETRNACDFNITKFLKENP